MAALLLLASCNSCTKRNPDVCCTSDTECARLGLPPGSVSEYSCGQGHVCRDFYCVPDEGPDASLPDAAVDAPSGRCNPNAPFGTPTRLVSLSTQFEDLSIAVTYDELKAYLVRSSGSNMVITTSRRESTESDFPAPTTDPELAAVAAGPDNELYLYPTSDDLALFYHQSGGPTVISGRHDPNEPFSASTEVYVNGAQFGSHQAMLSPDSLTLYWSGPSVPLRAATRAAYNWFVNERMATTFELTDFAISADQLTLYYSNFPNPDIFVSTRVSKDDPFGVGVPVGNVNTSDSDVPMSVSADGCLLYIRSNRPGSDGVNDLWVARRGR